MICNRNAFEKMLLFALSFMNYKLLVGECGCTVHHVVLNQEVSLVKPREDEQGKGGTSYNVQNAGAPPGKGTFFSLWVCERVGI